MYELLTVKETFFVKKNRTFFLQHLTKSHALTDNVMLQQCIKTRKNSNYCKACHD